MPPPTSHRPPEEGTTVPGRRVDESMTLLTSMMERPLDPGYAAAAERRTEAGLPAATSLRSVTVLVAALITGLLLTVGALSLRSPDTGATRARADLVRQIEERRAAADDNATTVRELQTEVNRAQAAALGGQQAEIGTRLASLERAAAAEPATGPGLTLTLDDAPSGAQGSADADPRTQAERDEGRVLGKDLQFVTNGLWEAGAEAIAINGQRLSSRSAIRFAGDAILVNYRPLTRPYVISAIGDPATLQADFAETAGGSYVRGLKDNYGIKVAMEDAKRLTLPGAASLTVRSAGVARTAAEQPGTTTSPTSDPRETSP